MKQKVLVTGAAGYIGSVLCERLLDAGHQVVGVDNLMYGQTSLFHLAANPGFQFVQADVMVMDTMRPLYAKADVIIPLAAIVGAAAVDRIPHIAHDTHVMAIRAMVNCLSSEQVVIYPNTNSGYGIGGEDVCTEETHQSLCYWRELGCPLCDLFDCAHTLNVQILGTLLSALRFFLIPFVRNSLDFFTMHRHEGTAQSLDVVIREQTRRARQIIEVVRHASLDIGLQRV